LPGHRRPLPRGHVPRRRRRRAAQRGARLPPQARTAPPRPPRRAAGAARARARREPRALPRGLLLGRTEPFLGAMPDVVIEVMGEAYPHIVERQTEIRAAIAREAAHFARTLDAGTRLLEAELAGLAAGERVVGRRADDLPPDSPRLD